MAMLWQFAIYWISAFLENTTRTRVFVVSVGRDSFRDGAALTQRRGKITLNPLDKALERPISTFSDTQNAPNVERRAPVPPHRAAP